MVALAVAWGFCAIVGNVSAMVSTGIEITEFPIKHLAKTFYFVLKPNQKIWRTWLKALKIG
jgi:hypothetical protein